MARRDEPPLPRRDPGIAAFLEEIRADCGAAGRLKRDPLALVVAYPDLADRELAGLLCSTLAFGSVDLILRACGEALAPLGPHPAAALDSLSDSAIARISAGFQYRFCFPRDMAALLRGARRARAEAGSLEAFFRSGDPGGEDIADATSSFVRRLSALGADAAGPIRDNLLPDPARGSACKRLFLYLRWMVRRDEVDPGGWAWPSPARLLVPLDTHLVRVCAGRLGFLTRPQADLRNARRATACFRLYAAEDPVRYDFALTRPGIDPVPGDERYGCA